MNVRKTVAAASAAAVLLVTGTAMAEPETHDGFFMRLGLNFGPLLTSASVDTPVGSSDGDFSGFPQIGEDLLFGGTVVDGLVIGGGLVFAHTSSPTFSAGGQDLDLDGTMLFMGLDAFGQYYFDPTSGFHLQGLVGFGILDAVSSSGTSGGGEPTGVNFGIGAGYDFWIGDQWSVGPFARVIIAPLSADSVSYTYIYPSIGAAITLH